MSGYNSIDFGEVRGSMSLILRDYDCKRNSCEFRLENLKFVIVLFNDIVNVNVFRNSSTRIVEKCR